MPLQVDPVLVSPGVTVRSAEGDATGFPNAARVSALVDPALLISETADFEVGVEWLSARGWQVLAAAGHDGGVVVRGGRGAAGPPEIVIHQDALAEMRLRGSALRGYVKVFGTRGQDVLPKGPVMVGVTVTAVNPFGTRALSRSTHHSVTFDASSLATGTGTSVTWSHTCTGTARGLYASLSYDGAPSDSSSTATYNAVSMTRLANLIAQQGLDLYRLVAPATGANNIVANWTASMVFAAAALSFTDVDQTTPDSGTATTSEAATGTSVTQDISSAAGGVVLDALSLNAGAASTTTPGADQTTNAVESEAAAAATLCGMSYEVGAATVTMSWSWTSSSTRNAHAAIAVNSASGSPPPVARVPHSVRMRPGRM